MPPISCTSKWRIASTRVLASRTNGKRLRAAARQAVSPLANALFELRCLAFQLVVGQGFQAVFGALILWTWPRYCLSSRSLRLPKIVLEICRS